MAEGRWQAPVLIEHTVGGEAGINLGQTFLPRTFVSPVTELEQVAVVVGEGEYWLCLLLDTARTVFRQDPPRLVLSSGQVSLTKCQVHSVFIGLISIPVGSVRNLPSWKTSRGNTVMLDVKIIISVVVI